MNKNQLVKKLNSEEEDYVRFAQEQVVKSRRSEKKQNVKYKDFLEELKIDKSIRRHKKFKNKNKNNLKDLKLLETSTFKILFLIFSTNKFF